LASVLLRHHAKSDASSGLFSAPKRSLRQSPWRNMVAARRSSTASPDGRAIRKTRFVNEPIASDRAAIAEILRNGASRHGNSAAIESRRQIVVKNAPAATMISSANKIARLVRSISRRPSQTAAAPADSSERKFRIDRGVHVAGR